MSLKAFHIFFIAISTLLTLGFAWWLAEPYTQDKNSMRLVAATLTVFLAVGLVIYGVWFLKKLKNIKFL